MSPTEQFIFPIALIDNNHYSWANAQYIAIFCAFKIDLFK